MSDDLYNLNNTNDFQGIMKQLEEDPAALIAFIETLEKNGSLAAEQILASYSNYQRVAYQNIQLLNTAHNDSATNANISSQLVSKDVELKETKEKLSKAEGKLQKYEDSKTDFSKRPFKICDNNGTLYACNGSDMVPVCENFIKSVQSVSLKTDEGEQIKGYLLLLEPAPFGCIWIDDTSLHKSKLLEKLETAINKMICAEKIPKTKLVTGFSLYIVKEAEETESFKIYLTSGWHDGKYHCRIKNDNAWNIVVDNLSILNVIGKKTLPQGTSIQNVQEPFLDESSRLLWKCAYFGSLISSILLECGLKHLPIICISKTEETFGFIQLSLSIWEEYQGSADINYQKELKESIKHTRDEPFILKAYDIKNGNKSRLDSFITSVLNNRSFMNMGTIEAIPFIITDHLFELLNGHAEDMIPLIPDSSDCSGSDIRGLGVDFIKWVQENEQDVRALLKEILSTATGSNNRMFFLCMTGLCSAYAHGYKGSQISSIYNMDDFTEPMDQTDQLLKRCAKYTQFTVESFTDAFFTEISMLNEEEIVISIENINKFEASDALKTIYYDDKGVYIKEELFKKICSKIGYAEKYTKEQLYELGALRRQKNGSGKYTYSIMHDRLGEKFLTFRPDTLLDSHVLSDNTRFKAGICIGIDEYGRKAFIPTDREKFLELPNPHINILGRSGMGKSTLMKKLADQAAAQGIPVLCVDAVNDINEKDIQQYPNMVIHQAEEFPINLLSAGNDNANYATELLTSAFSFQKDDRKTLLQAVANAYTKDLPISFLSITEQLDTIGTKSSEYLSERLRPYEEIKVFDKSGKTWEQMLYRDEAKFHVVKFDKKLFRRGRVRMAELILKSLSDWLITNNAKHEYPKPIMVMMDEIKYFSDKKEMPLRTLLSEGRGYGCMVVTATQCFTELREAKRDLLLSSGYQMYFHLPSDSVDELYSNAPNAGYTTDEIHTCRNSLGSLPRFSYLFRGPLSDTGENSLLKMKFAR